MCEPFVSALMAAYNAEAFVGEALESALAQDWPADRLEVVVCDDGSTDGTAAVVRGYETRFPGRVRLIRQANGGPCAAVNTALAAARGEWLGLLDADDAWPVDKLRVQGAVLASRPSVGLVYGDMRVVDAAGDVIQESWLADEPVIPRGPSAVGELLAGNVATASSLLMRRSVVSPIPAEIPYTDWWFAARAALLGEIEYVAEPRTLYRFHGGNITLGVEGAAKVRELRKALTFVRWFLRRMPAGAASPRGLATAWSYFEHCERELAAVDENPWDAAAETPGEPVSSGEARRNRRTSSGVPAGGEVAPLAGDAATPLAGARRGVVAAGGAPLASDAARLAALVRAAAGDPSSRAARDDLAVALAAALPAEAAALAGAGPKVAVAYAGELVADPALLAAWARELRGVPGVTLAVVTPPEATDALAAAAAALPDELDVVAVGAVDRDVVSAIVSERPRVEPPAPWFGADALARLAAAWA
ncbi:glycosyltransferase [Solirubrobacter soli]|uniref:glycosyltransferase n=1 Tax=Solirubrobacter soli TaxID=363832 RepID=UPI0004256571|nr:glycosyltransferase [Solirubrobacter soli]